MAAFTVISLLCRANRWPYAMCLMLLLEGKADNPLSILGANENVDGNTRPLVKSV